VTRVTSSSSFNLGSVSGQKVTSYDLERLRRPLGSQIKLGPCKGNIRAQGLFTSASEQITGTVIALPESQHCTATSPTITSGTFSSLCRVLCTHQSLYLCTISLAPILHLAKGTPCFSSFTPKKIYFAGASGSPGQMAVGKVKTLKGL
jgi:hypothetical protein